MNTIFNLSNSASDNNTTNSTSIGEQQSDSKNGFQGNQVAYGLVGTPIRISGSRGRIFIEEGKIKTGHKDAAEFVMEYAPIKENAKRKSKESRSERLVSFRLKDTNFYLSQNPYGDVAQAETLKNISSLPILPEISREIVDFAVGQENKTGEGQGFDYRPMQLEEGPPGLLQQFTLEGVGLRKVGIKSVYGKYWRAPTWSDGVLQSPNHLGDEDFTFCRVENQRWQHR